MRYIIPYSFSQQNEFYKVYNTRKKEKKKKKITVPQNCSDFTASVPLQKYLHTFKEHSSTAWNMSQLLTIDGKSRKL